MTEASDFVRELHDSLETEDVRRCLDAAASARNTPYSVLLAGTEEYSVYLGHACRDEQLVGDEAARALGQLLGEVTDRLEPVHADIGAPDAPVRAASTLKFRGESYGLFLLHGAEPEDVEWWRDIVDALSGELVKVQLYESANHESSAAFNKLDALHEAGQLLRYVDLETLLAKLLELSIRIMRAEVGAILLGDEKEWSTGIEWGLSEEWLKSLRTDEGRGSAEALLSADRMVHETAEAGGGWIDTRELDVHVDSFAFVPLTGKTRTLGGILVMAAGGGVLRPEDAEVLRTIAALCGTAVENAQLYESTRQNERLTAEMNLAAQLQSSLQPEPFLSYPEAEIAGWCMTASETGGDFYDYFDLGDDQVGIVVADATGHGMGAAMLAFIARATLRALLTHSQDLEHVMRTMNDLVEADCEDHRFLTCFFGILDRNTRVLRYASAGHDPPLVQREPGEAPIHLTTKDLPLGMFPGTAFHVHEFAPAAG